MAGCLKWYTVWYNNLIDGVFEALVGAKKHAAWLAFTKGEDFYAAGYIRGKISVTSDGYQSHSFGDYKFSNGESRKVKPK